MVAYLLGKGYGPTGLHVRMCPYVRGCAVGTDGLEKGNLLPSVALIYVLRMLYFLSQKCCFSGGKGTWPAARGIRQANDIRQMTKLSL